MSAVGAQVNAKRAVFFIIGACLFGALIGSAVTFAVLTSQRAIPSAGLIVAVNVGVYSDAACTLNVTSIDWGSVYPGGSVSRMVYVKNTGNVPLTLSMSTSGWNPAVASGQISVVWDKENALISSGQSTAATLTLSAVQSIAGVTSFSVNLIITGSG